MLRASESREGVIPLPLPAHSKQITPQTHLHVEKLTDQNFYKIPSLLARAMMSAPPPPPHPSCSFEKRSMAGHTRALTCCICHLVVDQAQRVSRVLTCDQDASQAGRLSPHGCGAHGLSYPVATRIHDAPSAERDWIATKNWTDFKVFSLIIYYGLSYIVNNPREKLSKRRWLLLQVSLYTFKTLYRGKLEGPRELLRPPQAAEEFLGYL